MTTRNLMVLVGVAAVLGGAAYWLSSGSSAAARPSLNGRTVFPGLSVEEVASVEVGGTLKVAAGSNGWTVATYHGYPADRGKIVANLLKLAELKVGQSVRGKTLDETSELKLRDAAGRELATLTLGPRHAKWGRGRYAAFEGQTVLVSDALEAFEGDGREWVERKIVDEPWISFTDIAADATEAECGFATGVVARVTVAGDTNRLATVGAPVKGGSERYFKLDGSPWVYTVPGYSVEKLLPKPEPAPAKSEPEGPESAKPAEPAEPRTF